MTNHVYVGGLAWETTEQDLKTLFSADGRTVQKATIVTDHGTGRSRGFAFIDMGSEEEAQAVIQSLHGTELNGRTIKVNVARDRQAGRGDRGGHSGGGRRRGPW